MLHLPTLSRSFFSLNFFSLPKCQCCRWTSAKPQNAWWCLNIQTYLQPFSLFFWLRMCCSFKIFIFFLSSRHSKDHLVWISKWRTFLLPGLLPLLCLDSLYISCCTWLDFRILGKSTLLLAFCCCIVMVCLGWLRRRSSSNTNNAMLLCSSNTNNARIFTWEYFYLNGVCMSICGFNAVCLHTSVRYRPSCRKDHERQTEKF